MPQQNQNTINWEAHEFKHYPKTSGWYTALIVVAALTVAFFLLERDIFGAVSLAIIAALVFLFARQTPQTVTIELSAKGVKFGKLFYSYKELKYFWIVHDQNHRSVNFHTSALVNNTLILELDGQDPEAVRRFLLRFLPEHSETQATMAQKIMHKFKF